MSSLLFLACNLAIFYTMYWAWKEDDKTEETPPR